MVQENVLASIPDDRLVIHVVWMPILGPDSLADAMKSRQYISDARARHYWTPQQDLGILYGDLVKLPRNRELAWDIYFVYDEGTEWGDTSPVPTDWFHQLGSDGRHLEDGEGLRESIERLLSNDT